MATVIEGPYTRDIAAQPQAVQDTLKALVPSPTLQTWGHQLAGTHAPLVLTGMGASLSALVPLQLKLIEAGLAPILIETSELIHHAWALVRPGATVVAVSQSGRSAEMLRLLDRLPEGVKLIGVTNDATSDLATRASLALLTNAGPEATVSCKTYLSALLALQWLGAHLVGEDLQAAREELAKAPTFISQVLVDLPERVDALAAVFAETALIYFAGRGASLGSATCAGLITKEAVHFPAEGLSSAAFRHGPLEMVGPQVYLVVFEGTGVAAALNANLVNDVRSRGGGAALCGVSGTGPFQLPAAPARLLPMLEILIAQQITLALSLHLGRQAGTFTHASKITVVE